MEEQIQYQSILLRIKSKEPFTGIEHFDKWFRGNFKEVNEILEDYTKAKISRVLDDTYTKKLQQIIKRANHRTGKKYQIEEFTNLVRIDTNQLEGVEILVQRLNNLEFVDLAYVQPQIFTPIDAFNPEKTGGRIKESLEKPNIIGPVNPKKPLSPTDSTRPAKEKELSERKNLSFVRRRIHNYFDAAPIGVDVAAGNHLLGADGFNIQVIDIEQGWFFNHPNLNNDISLIDGINLQFEEHGTAVLGILKANGTVAGQSGMVKNTSCDTMSVWHSDSDGVSRNRIDLAIIGAIWGQKFGDIVLIEQHVNDPNPQSNLRFLPVEVDPWTFRLIEIGTAAGTTFIECAGNGHQDLDNYNHHLLNNFFREFENDGSRNRNFKDSGAIIVGAGDPDNNHQRLFRQVDSGSNFGSRIDCFAWGKNIRTLNNLTNKFTNDFGGTSGAGAIIAGVAAMIQGIALEQRGFLLPPEDLRAILANPDLGTPSNDTRIDRIGFMPDLAKIIAEEFTTVIG